jgi:ribonuclease HI
MPAWHHAYSIEGPRKKTYNNKWGRCHQETHSFTTTGDLYHHVMKNKNSEHRNRYDCDCYGCYADRLDGCQDPIACRRSADDKLGMIRIDWNPKHRAAMRSWEKKDDDPQEEENPDPEPEDRELVWVPRIQPNNDPNEHVKVFTSGRRDICIPQIDTRDQARRVSTITLYTDGSSLENGEQDSRTGSGVWYGPEDERNRAIRLPPLFTTNNAAELAAILIAIQDNREAGKLIIHLDSQYAIDAVTTHLGQWVDEGFIRRQNKEILQTIYGELLHMETEIALKKVEGHSGIEGNKGADRLADRGAWKDDVDSIDVTQGDFIEKAGTRLRVMTQSTLYHGIMSRKARPTRESTRRNIELAQNLIEENTGKKVSEDKVWMTLTRDKAINKKPRMLIWKMIHDAHKVGRWWRHTKCADEYMACKECDTPEESMRHILLECEVSGQRPAWKAARQLWERTGLGWPTITMGLIYGISLYKIRNSDGTENQGVTKLFRILVTETIYLIWLVRCRWRIEDESDPMKTPTDRAVEERWRDIISKRLRYDRILTNRKAFGKKSIKIDLVRETWERVVYVPNSNEPHLPKDWVTKKGVLVGIPGNRRPPGRNR